MKTQKKILIVGAGITGLTLAGLLERSGYRITLIDNAEKARRPGYGITIMPEGMAAINMLGLRKQLMKLGTSAQQLELLSSPHRRLAKFTYAALHTDSVTLNRAHLHALLESKVTSTHVRYNTSVTKLRQLKRGVRATFTDGNREYFDLVVGADGINSVVRTMLFPGANPEKVGAATWTVITPKSYVYNHTQTVKAVIGKGKFMGVFPINKRAAVTFSMPLDPQVNPWDVDITKEFSDMSPQAKAILHAIKHSSVFATQLRQVKLRHYYKGDVLLAGDAAHAMVPATGMGASMGMQDAIAIATLLIEQDDVSQVPAAYETWRRAEALKVQKRAFLVGKILFSKFTLRTVRDNALAIVLNLVFSRKLKRTS